MKKCFLMLLILCVVSSMALTVYDIQYSMSGDSPYDGEVVTVSGVVAATEYSGDKYYLSDSEGGPWHGVYVYDYVNSVSLGDYITITATVDEYYGLTELTTITAFSSDSTGSVPDPWPTSCGVADTFEALEGVLVTLSDVVVVGGVDSLWEISDVTGNLKVKRGFDYSYSPNAGDTIETITGMMSYSWNEYVLEPRSDDDISATVDTSDTSGPSDTLVIPIADIQADPSAFDEVVVEGVITAAAGALKTTQLKAYIQDESGKGIQLFEWSLTADMESLLVRGAVARVSGTISEYLGTTEIEVSDWEIVGEDTLPTPLDYSSVISDAAAWEGVWTVVQGTVYDRYGTGDGNWNVVVDDGGVYVSARIWSTTGLDGDSINIGDGITIYGIAGVYNDEFQILPASVEDIVIVPFVTPPSGESSEIIIPQGVFVPISDDYMNVQFTVPVGSRAVLRLFDRMGRNVTTLYDGTPSSTVSMDWDGRDETSQLIGEGVYMLLLESIPVSGSRESVKKTIAIGSALK
ncbi:hypothetical protein KAH81_06155 [bacterium]|nr:hypothetical protein [bacterium]